MKGLSHYIFLGLMVFLLANCAKRSRPSGGPEDKDAPIMVSAKPPHFTTNFDAKEIKIIFDEFIKLDKVMEQLVVSPPLKYPPIIKPLGTASKQISIKIVDTLKANTTYTFNFGESVVDNNEKNILRNFKYVFSTGPIIDSLKIKGTIKDAFAKESDDYITVMLYEVNEAYNDSTVYKEKPIYVGSTLDSTTWEITNIKEGNYALIALKDRSKNYLFDPKFDKIGFHEKHISIPGDSIFELAVFKEELPFNLKRPSEIDKRLIQFGYEGDPKELSIIALNSSDNFKNITDFEKDKDTLNYWHSGIKDSIVFKIDHPVYQDTITVNLRTKKVDSLRLSTNISRNLHPRDTFKINSSIPISKIDTTLISFLYADSIKVPYDLIATKRTALIDFDFTQNQTYKFTALPGAITDFFGKKNDTLTYSFTSKKLTDYGSIFLTLSGIQQYPILIHLLDSKGALVGSKYSQEEEEYTFLHLVPDTYFIRLIIDENENGKWDTGNYLLKRKPEKVLYLEKEILIKANWEVKAPMILVID